MAEYDLEFLGRLMLDMRADMREFRREVEGRFDRVEVRLDTLESIVTRHQDELTVTTAMVMRHAGEHVAWGTMERQIKALAERLATIEARLPAAE